MARVFETQNNFLLQNQQLSPRKRSNVDQANNSTKTAAVSVKKARKDTHGHDTHGSSHGTLFKQGMAVYIPCQLEGWQPATVIQAQQRHLLIESQDGQTAEVLSDRAVLRQTTDDLTQIHELRQLSPLSPASVLDCLRRRYSADVIYTTAGSTLVAVNPFKVCPQLYGQDVIKKYHSHWDTDTDQHKLPPHVYQVAETAHRALTQGLTATNHSVIVSGESGSGKTVTAKHLMKYLVTVGNKPFHSTPGIGGRIERRILDSNPLLEAFGNASTVRNDNSSRFGKYIQLQFDRAGHIEGATIQTYLLEKTRVVHQMAQEFNFHIFYQLLSACQRDRSGLSSQLGLAHCHTHTFRVAQLNNRDINEDLAKWHITREAMTDIGLTPEQQENIFQLLVAILLLGNLEFLADPDDEDVCFLNTDDTECERCCGESSRLLGVDQFRLESVLTHRQITASHSRRHSVFHKPCTQQQTRDRRDCLAKLLYARLFEWLVTFINQCIHAESAVKSVGILDIYGFESFQQNSLEQLCINYSNEKLQQHYVVHFLKDLQADYAKEAIAWTFTDYVDNRPCLDLLEGNPSVFAILNEECHLNRPANTEALAHRLAASFHTNCHFGTPGRHGLGEPNFIIQHYAEPVQYAVEGLLHKNKDDVPSELVQLMTDSTNSFLAELFADWPTQQTGAVRKKTVLSKFKQSLDSLLQLLCATQPHYIRCIKPNPANQPADFKGGYVLRQLQASGVVETVNICKQGYPARIPYTDFLRQYGLILRSAHHHHGNHTINQSHRQDDNKENEFLFEPLEVLYKQQLNLTPRPKSSTPKRKLRRRAVGLHTSNLADLPGSPEATTGQEGLSSSDHTRKLCAAIMTLVFGGQDTDSPQLWAQFGRTKLFLKDGQLEKLESRRTKLLSQHVFTIQCAWRRFTRRRHQCTLQAVITLQAAIRGWQTRHMLHRQRQAAKVIQRSFRQYRAEQQHREDSQFKPDSVQNSASERVHTDVHFDVHSVIVQPSADVFEHCDKKAVSDSGVSEQTVVTSSSLRHGVTNNREVYHNVAAAITAAVLTQTRFQLSGAFCGIPYLEAQNGVVSRRRMPRVQIKFHTRPNRLLRYGHYISRRELECSLTDCLPHWE